MLCASVLCKFQYQFEQVTHGRCKSTCRLGGNHNFIHPNFVKRMGIGQRELDKPKNIYNIDDTTNRAGQITHYLNLAVTTGEESKK
jgi:hypothetical protein